MLIILKLIFLTLAVAYGISFIIRICYKSEINELQLWLLAISIVGFVTIQFDLWK